MGKYAKIFTEPSMTKQSFKDECDINKLMDKYQKTGLLTHVNNNKAHYGEFEATDFTTAMQTIAEGQSMFAELPSATRKYFDNDPAKFMAFTSNPDNIDKMVELGLAERSPWAHEAPPTAQPADISKSELSPKAPESTEVAQRLIAVPPQARAQHAKRNRLGGI